MCHKNVRFSRSRSCTMWKCLRFCREIRSERNATQDAPNLSELRVTDNWKVDFIRLQKKLLSMMISLVQLFSRTPLPNHCIFPPSSPPRQSNCQSDTKHELYISISVINRGMNRPMLRHYYPAEASAEAESVEICSIRHLPRLRQ